MTSMRAALAGTVAIALGATGVALVPAPPAGAGAGEVVTALVSGTTNLAPANGSSSALSLADDGRYVAFVSSATNLVPGASLMLPRVYVRDLLTDKVELISRRADGTPSANGSGDAVAITPDGRYVAFSSNDALLAADTNTSSDVYRRDRKTGSMTLVSVSGTETVGNLNSGSDGGYSHLAISDDGRYVAFHSAATNLVLGDTNAKVDIFRRDITNGTTSRVNQDGALQANGHSYDPDMSADGRYIVWETDLTNFAGIDTNGSRDIWLRDINSIGPSKMSMGNDADPNGNSTEASISDNGRYIAFTSNSTDLVTGDTNGSKDVFVRDRTGFTTTRVSVTGTNTQLNGDSSQPDIAWDGNEVAFRSVATNAVAGDTNGVSDIFVRSGNFTQRVSLTTTDAQVNSPSYAPSISKDNVGWASAGAFTTIPTAGNFNCFVRLAPFIGPHPVFEDYAGHQLQGFTGAAPAAAVSAASARMRAGASPERFTADLARATTFSAKKAPVIRLYWAFFKRRPDLGGLNYWIAKYSTGALTLNGIAQKFAQSAEFKATYGPSTTNAQFVTLVYNNVLDRDPDAAGLAFWVGKMTDGLSRGGVMTSFSESPEGKDHIHPQVAMILLSLGMMKAIPSKPLFDGVVAALASGQPDELAVDYILGAPEYAATL